jgi:hypothetical protein
MLTNGGLRESDFVNDFARNTAFATAEVLQNGQPCGVTEYFEDLCKRVLLVGV